MAYFLLLRLLALTNARRAKKKEKERKSTTANIFLITCACLVRMVFYINEFQLKSRERKYFLFINLIFRMRMCEM